MVAISAAREKEEPIVSSGWLRAKLPVIVGKPTCCAVSP
jgi:hypothetical protein